MVEGGTGFDTTRLQGIAVEAISKIFIKPCIPSIEVIQGFNDFYFKIPLIFGSVVLVVWLTHTIESRHFDFDLLNRSIQLKP